MIGTPGYLLPSQLKDMGVLQLHDLLLAACSLMLL
jgi:hypothetical protein